MKVLAENPSFRKTLFYSNSSVGLHTCCADRKETYEGTESLRITKISGRPVPDGKSGLPFSMFFSKKYNFALE